MPGKPFAVFDFGGGTLDVAVLERRDSTFEVLGIDGADPLGGEDLDDLLFGHVVNQLSGRIDTEALLHATEWYGHRV